jgi:selenocysteine lyase/cysteine desulfurase
MKSVEEAGIRGLRLKQAPQHIGHHEFFGEVEELRAAYARLISVDDPLRIVVIPSVSYGMAIVARNLKLNPGDNIVVVGEQFPSNVYPWQKLAKQQQAHIKTVHAPDVKKGRGKLWNEQLLEAIDEQTRLVAIANVHWSDGTRFDLRAVRERTRAVGALLVIDGTQSVGALPLDVSEIQPDALICAGYKWLMGPYAISMAYLGPYFDDGEPLEEGWISRYNSEDFTKLVNYQERYQPGALRYEMGERSNFILVPMMLQALQELNHWGVENIQAYCQHLAEPAIEELRQLGFLVEEPTFRGSHMFGVRLPEQVDMAKLQQKLKEEGVLVSVRGNSVRVSVHLYNDKEDLHKLLRCFQAVL